MPKFMLVLHNPPHPWKDLTPEALENRFAEYRAWSEKIRASGRHVSSEKLAEEGGKILERRHGRLSVVDGPYCEAKEVVGGYLLFRAASYDEALELVRDCPFLDDGRIELRQTDPTGCGGE